MNQSEKIACSAPTNCVSQNAPPTRKRRVAKTEPAAIPKGRRPSESVDEVDLLALKQRFLGAGSLYGAPDRRGVHVILWPPHRINAVLQNVPGAR